MADVLLARIIEAYPTLSPQSQRIARDLEMDPAAIAFGCINDIANRCSVHHSSVVRFAKRFGLSGFRELREIFRWKLLEHDSPPAIPIDSPPSEWKTFLSPRMQDTRQTLSTWRATIAFESIGTAARHLLRARTIKILSTSKAFPVACYCLYCLQGIGKVVEIMGHGSIHATNGNPAAKSDCCLVFSIGQGRRSRALARLARMESKYSPSILITDDAGHQPLSDFTVFTVASPSGIDFDTIASVVELCEYILFFVSPTGSDGCDDLKEFAALERNLN